MPANKESNEEVEFECKTKHPDLYRWYCDIYDRVKQGKAYKQKKRRLRMWDKWKDNGLFTK